MTVSLRFHTEALAEIRDTALWYEQERSGLGEEYLAALRTQLEELARDRSLGSRLPGSSRSSPVRRILLPRFPYAVLFIVRESEIRVIAVMHGKRKPGYWLGRIHDQKT